ncbi:MAG: zf-HC2 domain-containing protein [Acidimicrobiia bacterium]|nr:zf-HC2 domain-containing protein [Acidimicrobiia bacterium]
MSAHPGDLLSAYLDGELTPREADGVRAHLDGCVECRRELEFIGEARTFVRDLPPVDPPFGLFERMLRPKHRWARTGVGALAAGAVASVAVMALVAPREPHVSTNVAQLVSAHTASASSSGDPISEITPSAVPVSFNK